MDLSKKLNKKIDDNDDDNSIIERPVIKKKYSRRDFLSHSLMLSLGGLMLNKCSFLQNDKNNNKKIVIIGAGISGLTAASELINAGFEVIILEARNRIGGRIQTINFNGFKMDAGASWIHGTKNNPLYLFSQKENIQTIVSYDEPSYLYDVDGKPINVKAWNEIKKNLNYLYDKSSYYPDKSLAELSDMVESELNLNDRSKRLYYGAIRTEVEIPYAEDGKDLSSRVLLSNDSFSGNNVLFPNGMTQIIENLSNNVDTRLNSFVTNINYDSDVVEIFFTDSSKIAPKRSCHACHWDEDALPLANDKSIIADMAIVTLPLGMLKNRIVKFFPELPLRKTDAINKISLGTMNKVFLYFDKSFWPEDAYFLEYFKEDSSNMMVFESFSNIYNKNVLTAFLSGKQARMIEKLDERTTINLVTSELKKMFGSSVPVPKKIYKTGWHTDPFALGAYPHIPPGSKLSYCDRIEESIDNKIFFAGDATSSAYLATAHGAYISGINAAKKIINLK